MSSSSTSIPREARKRERKSARPKLTCRPPTWRAPERYTTPPPCGLRRVVTLSSVFMSQPSGTSSVNQPRASARTVIESRLVYDLTRPCARRLAAADDDLAPDDDVADPG